MDSFNGRAQGRPRSVQVAKLVHGSTQLVMRFGEFISVRGYDLLACFDHAVQIAIVVKRAREVQVSVGEDWLLLDRSPQLLNGLFKLARLIERHAQAMMRPGQFFIKL